MTEEDIIYGLKDQIRDKESFITKESYEDEDDAFVEDKKVLEEAIKLIQKQQKEIGDIKQYWQWSLDELQEYHKIASDLKYECTSLIYKLEKKDKIIDEIYNIFYEFVVNYPATGTKVLSQNGFDTEKCGDCDIECKECIKQYLIKKVEENK